MKRFSALIMVLAVAACSPAKSGSLGPGPSAPVTSPSTPPSPVVVATDPPASGPTTSVQIWLQRDGKLFPTRRTRPATVATSRLALTELIAGPSKVEEGVGVASAIGPGTSFEIKGIAGGVETVSFPSAFYQGRGVEVRLRQAQVIFTLTQFPSVTRVVFLADGQATLGGPATRADLPDLLPHIVVLSPVIGERVSSPVTVSGTADVGEATVSMSVFDASGKEIASKFATATCGSGCRGTYSATVPFRPCLEAPGMVQVYESSREDGSRINIVNIPVILSGCR